MQPSLGIGSLHIYHVLNESNTGCVNIKVRLFEKKKEKRYQCKKLPKTFLFAVTHPVTKVGNKISKFYLPSEVASGTEVLKVCCEPFIDVAQSQLSGRRLKEYCLNIES